MTTKVTGKNQVTIPATIAREYDIHPGTELAWSKGADENTIMIRVMPSVDDLLNGIREDAAKYNIDADSALVDLQQMRDDDETDDQTENTTERHYVVTPSA